MREIVANYTQALPDLHCFLILVGYAQSKSSDRAEFPVERPPIMRTSYAAYLVELPVRYTIRGETQLAGQGRTLTISRGILRFACDRWLPTDKKIQLVLDWPAILPDGTALSLCVMGTVTRGAADSVEVRVDSYEFKARRQPQRASAPRHKGGIGLRSMTASS